MPAVRSAAVPVILVPTRTVGVPRFGVVSTGEVSVLFVKVSVPANVASVPVVGSVTPVAPVVVKVVANAPLVIRELLSAKVRVAPVAGAVSATLFTLVAVATPMFGVIKAGEVKVLLVKVSVPASVARVPVVGKVTFVAAVDVNVVANAPDVARVLLSAKVSVAAVAGAVIANLFTDVAVATPMFGVVNVLFVKVSVPVRVARVPPAGKITVPEATALASNMVEPLVEPARISLPTAPPIVPKVLAPVTV